MTMTMTMKCGSIAMVVSSTPLRRPMFLASSTAVNAEQLRANLDQLHAEAETTRTKANLARMRLMRLSEAAENLKRQAAISVGRGNEDDARELLFQKKKVMQAMETSRDRIVFLDKLSSRLTEVISMKENQLIGSVDMDLEIDSKDSHGPVRVVSPKQETAQNDDKDEGFSPNPPQFNEDDQILESHSDDEATDQRLTQDVKNFGGSGLASSLKGISSYEDFLEHIDQQLNTIEEELVTVLNLSTLVMSNKEKPENLRVQQTMELLESICTIRQRIARNRANCEVHVKLH